MKSLVLALVLSASTISAATINGTALLSGQTNHLGIKVRFFANSGTAITDSCLTDAVGNYSVNLAGGLYKIDFSKTGFQTAYYNNNSLVTISTASILSTQTLASGTSSAVIGNVSGNWSGTTTFLVTGNLIVPLNQTLSIQAGATIKFVGSYSLTVFGTVLANGTAANPIVFTSNNTGTTTSEWRGVYVYSSNSSFFNFCSFERCDNGFYLTSSSISILNCTIRNFYSSGITSISSSPTIKSNTIYDYEFQDYGYGISTNNGAPLIECNTIYNGRGRGISTQSNGTIKNNIIHHISNPQRGFGIDCSAFCTTTISNNIIHDCEAGIRLGETVQTAVEPVILNNTIYSNNFGISMPAYYSKPVIINNAIVSNTFGLYQNSCATCANNATVISQNDVWNNTSGNYSGINLTSIGQTVTTNANGTPIDPYFNMSVDPSFLNNTPPQLNAGSPCINAGDAVFGSNIGTNLTKLCIGMETGISDYQKANLFSILPNPATSSLFVHSTSNGRASIQLIDLMGKIVFETEHDFDDHGMTIDLSMYHNGVFVVVLRTKNGQSQTSKFIKQ
jgi:hypothetical protein